MEYFGYFASILIGVALGLIGGGGSILTVPVLVYLLGVDAVAATSYSLFIVGTTSAIGSVQYFKKNLVNIKTAIVFGIPSIIAVFLTRAYIVPAIPNEVFTIGTFVVTKSILMMLLFAILMIAASYSMIKKNKEATQQDGEQKFNYPLILIEGIVVGTLTGLVGAGGGFLIIPALVILSKLPMKEAVGTSLVIIAAKSLIGFLGEGGDALPPNWKLILTVTSFAILGIFIGTALSKKVDGAKLKPAFGWFVLIMGIYIIAKELFFK
ncbi:MAG: sulfite exporter TauE/SafE family protein [Ferruginibacter sp.]|nr:sulfite exporter TauE/SafE family protein [Ferruginibacter sp.]